MHGMITTILSAMIVVVALVMLFMILIQQSNGGALTVLDGTKAANLDTVSNPIRRTTAILAGLFFVLVIVRTKMGG